MGSERLYGEMGGGRSKLLFAGVGSEQFGVVGSEQFSFAFN